MKYIMMTTLLIILTMTFSCTDKSSENEVISEVPEVEVVQKQELEETLPEAQIENVAVKDEVNKTVVNRISKRFYKKTSGDEKQIGDDISKSNVEKPIEETSVSDKIARRTEKGELVKTVKSEPLIEETIADEKIAPLAKPDHSLFNTLLANHVNTTGVVNYTGLKKDINKLDAYLKELDENVVADEWSSNEKLAYWINAYNAFTIKLILDNYPVNSIQDINGGKPWDKKWINLGGKTYSLNQIENDIIRPQFKEPRIHFAVNCAAQSCPPLANQAFTANNLNSLLEKQTKSFVNNSKFNSINQKSVSISKIFDWYGADFGDKIAFLNKYSAVEINNNAKIDYTEYNWSLNNK